MVFWWQGSNGVMSGASCILSVRVLMGGMLGGILGDGTGVGCNSGGLYTWYHGSDVW